jgi:hypothetical protein
MFSKLNCCSSVDATVPQPAKPLSIRAPTHTRPALLKSAGDPEPLPTPLINLDKVSPPTPDLTPDEIAKIQANLLTMEAFAKDVWLQQGQIISEVWAKIEGMAGASRVSNSNKLKELFEDWLDISAFALTAASVIPTPLAPIFGVVAVVLATTSYLLTHYGSDTKSITGGTDISTSAGSHFEINNAHYYALIQVLDYFRDNTNECRDYIFKSDKCPNKQATLRDLINQTFPTGTYYNMWLRLQARSYRRKMVLPELVKQENQFMDLYFIQDSTSNAVEFGHLYQPCAAPGPWKGGQGTERKRYLNSDGAGTNVCIWSNDEVRHYHQEYTDVAIKGSSDTDASASWFKATGDFIGKFPQAYIYPWAMSDTAVYSQKYYIIGGFDKKKDDENKPKFDVANADFLHWLFIDDGVGNITNVDGVAFRYEVFQTKRMGFANDIFLHAQQISDDIGDQPQEKWIKTCADYRYGPESSRVSNAQYHVYTGDMLLKNLPADPI